MPVQPGRDQHLHRARPQEAAGTQLPQEGGHQVSNTGLFSDCVIKLIIFSKFFASLESLLKKCFERLSLKGIQEKNTTL